MRRRRHQLQVSTFPFLAVLLCAMGSLILLLLVIDRRAKEAAREKALRAYRQSTAEQERLAAARKAELERQSQELHARLLHANESMLAQVHATEDDLRAALRRLDDARRKYQKAQTRMLTATDRLQQDQSQLGHEQGAVLRATQAADANRKELARLAAELRELEQTVIDLKLARQRQVQTYSLMPYRGRQGENRQPLYIECAALGYVFHPDRLAMRLSQVRLAEIRAEVERRLARLREMAQGEAKKPYVLLLVRPDGIESYYVLMSALDGLGLDFGYEFVERDWVLDFQNEGVLGNQPWMAEATPAAPARSDLKPLDLRRRNHASLTGAYTFGATGGGTSGSGVGLAHGIRDGAGRVGGGMMANGPGAGRASGPGSGYGGHGSGNAGDNKAFAVLGTPIGAQAGGGSGGGRPGAVASANGSARPGIGWVASGSQAAAAGGGGPAGSSATGIPGKGGSDATTPGTAGLGFGPSVGGGSHGEGGTDPGRAVSVSGSSSNMPTLGPTGNSPAGRGSSGGVTGSRPSGNSASSAGPSAPSNGSTSGVANNTGTPPTSSTDGATGTQAAAPPSDSIRAQDNAPPGGGANSSGAGTGSGQTAASSSGGSAGSGSPGDPAASPASASPAEPSIGGTPSSAGPGGGDGAAGGPAMLARPDALAGIGPNQNKARPRTPVVRPAILTANRDWIVGLECRGTEIIVHPGQKAFAVAGLEDGSTGSAFVHALQDLIARRQASVLPGQPPYRPLLRFLVWPNGLRGYYDAYPLLEGLRLPMSRVDVHSNDELHRALYPGG